MAEQRLDILIDIRSRLEGLEKSVAGMTRLKKESEGFARFIKQGFGIDIAARATATLDRAFRAVLATARQIPRELIQARLEADRITRSLSFVFGSAQAGAVEFERLAETADRYGQSIGGIALEYARLTAASKASSFSLEDANQLFEATLAASTVLGLTAEQTSGIFNAFQQIISKGVLSAEELRQQLGDRLPGAFGLAARAMGVSVQELNKMIAAGEVLAEDILPKLSALMLQEFGPGVADASRSLQAAINRMDNAIFRLKIQVGEAGFTDAFIEAINKLSDSLSDPALEASAESLGASMGDLVKTMVEITIWAPRAAKAYKELWNSGPVLLASLPMRVASELILAHIKESNEEASKLANQLQQNEQLASRDKFAIFEGAQARPPPTIEELPTVELEAYTVEARSLLSVQQELATVRERLARSELDPFRTEVEKRGEIAELLRSERSLLIELRDLRSEENTAFLQREIELQQEKILKLKEAGGEYEKELQTLIKLREQQAANVVEIEQIGTALAEIDVALLTTSSFAAELNAEMIAFADGFGSRAQQVAGILTGTIGTAIDSTSDAISGLLLGTKDFGDAWRQVAGDVVTQLVMLVVRYAVTRAAMAAISKVFGATELTVGASQAAATAAAWSPAAIAVSIATFGSAAGVGLSAYLGALATGTALSTVASGIAGFGGGFAEGGYTGPGGKYKPAGIVHAGEFVMPADVVRSFGPGYFYELLEELRFSRGRTYAEGGLVSSAPAIVSRATAETGGAGQAVSIALVNTREEMREFMQREGARIAYDVITKRQRRF